MFRHYSVWREENIVAQDNPVDLLPDQTETQLHHIIGFKPLRHEMRFLLLCCKEVMKLKVAEELKVENSPNINEEQGENTVAENELEVQMGPETRNNMIKMESLRGVII